MSQRRIKKKSTETSLGVVDATAVLVDNFKPVAERLDAGESLLANGQEQELSKLRMSLPEVEPSAGRETFARALRLSAFSNAHSGDLINAEQSIEKGLELYPDALDLLYLSAFAAVSFHEHQRALDIITKFRQIFGSGTITAPQIPGAYLSAAHLSQLANMAGVSLRSLGRLVEAEQEYLLAIESDPGQHLAWLNLLHLFSSMGRNSELSALVKSAQSACPEITEFSQFLSPATPTSGPSVAVCMIVKNEEELLPRALESVKGFASEIIIVDTGSTDRTREIARSFGAKVVDEPWEGNFSKHRNTSLSHATTEWIFILDADERLETQDIANLQQVMSKTDHSVISINVFNLYGKKRESHNFLPSIRLFRRALGLRYEGIVHNVLKVSPTEPVLRTNTRLWHLGYDLSSEKMQKKFERSKALLESQLEENPKNAFAHFNYAQLLRGAELEVQKARAAEIIHSATRAVELTGPKSEQQRHIHLMALNQLAWAHFVNDNVDLAHAATDKVLKLKSDYLDPLMLRGHLFSKAEKFDEAIRAYTEFLSAQASYRPELEMDDIIVANVSNRAAAYYGIALANHALGRVQEAKRFYRETLRENDEYHEANQFLGLLELQDGNELDAIKFLENQLRTEQPTVHAAVALANIERSRMAISRALQYAIQAVEIDSKNEAAVTLLVELLVQSGRPLELPALFERVQQHGIRVASLQAAEGRGWFSLGEFSRAAELLELATRVSPAPADLATLAEAQFKTGNIDGATESYQLSLSAGYTDSVINRNYGVALAKVGKLHQAATTLRAYLQQLDADKSMWELVGDLYLRLKEYSLAVEAFEQMIRFQGTSKTALIGLSTAYEALGHLQSARMGYEQLSKLYPDDPRVSSRLTLLNERCAESEQVH